MNKQGEFYLIGFLAGILTVGLLAGVFTYIIVSSGSGYNIDNYNSADLERYEVMPNLSANINSAYEQIDQTTINGDAFDWLADVWSKIITPFKFTYNSFKIATGLTGDIILKLQLLSIFGSYLVTLIMLYVIIGIVMKKYIGK